MRSSLSILGSCKSSPLGLEMHQPRIHSRILTFDLQRSLGSYCFNYVVIVAMRAIFVATAISMECESLCNQLTCLSSKSLTSFRNALLHFLHIRVWAIGQLLLGNPTITHYFLIFLDSMIWPLLFMTNIAIKPFAACKTVRTRELSFHETHNMEQVFAPARLRCAYLTSFSGYASSRKGSRIIPHVRRRFDFDKLK